MSIGKGTAAGKELSGFISEIEKARDRKKQIGDQEKEIFAAAKAKGYDTKTIRRILKLRAADQKQHAEAEALFDSYAHAIGMEEELPLFRAVGMMGVDTAIIEDCVEALSQLVPVNGEITVRVGAAHIRLYRDTEGEAHAEEVTETRPLRAKRDPRYADGEEPLSEPTSVYPPSVRARGLSKEAIRAAVERAEASAAAAKAGASPA